MPKQPNILFAFTDQQRWDTTHAAGNPHIRTPVMDRLCHEGVNFTKGYTPSPVCVSARASLITGQYPHKNGCFDNGFRQPTDRPSLMDLLAQGGYLCHGVGKMHFTGDRGGLRGFHARDVQEEISGTIDTNDYLKYLHAHGYDYVHDPMGARGEMYYIPQISQLPARHHPTAWVADRSIDFLKNRDTSKPFFLWSSFIHPHPPFSPPTPWNKLYRGSLMPFPKRPDNMEDLWTHFNRHQNRYKYRDAGLDNRMLQVMRGYYWACISFIDYSVGRIIDELEQQGELDNTLIAWSSDHGELLGDYNCFGKRSFLDAAARVPMLVRYPERFPRGAVEETPCGLMDLIPTFLGAAGISDHNADLDGLDMADLVGNGQERMIYGQIQRGQRGMYMAYDGNLKYIYSAGDQKEYLLDHRTDAEETRNCAYNILYASEVKTMREKLIGFFQNESYTDPLDGDQWKDFGAISEPKSADANLLIQDAGWAVPLYNIPGYSVERGEK